LNRNPGFARHRESAPLLFAALLIATGAWADAPRIHAITDVRVVTAPGRVIDAGTVVLRDGRVEAVGAGIAPPPDARVIAGAENWTVYPAFIDAAASLGLDSEAGGGGAGGPPGRPRSAAEPSRPGARHELEPVHPQDAVVDALDFAHASVARHRELGFAVAQVLPGSGVFRGQSAVVLLRDGPAPELVLSDRNAQVIALETSSFMARQYPSSVIGALAAVRQTLLDAQRQMTWSERYAADPAGMRRPEFRASDAALLAILRGERPVVFVARAGLDPGRFSAIANEFELRGMTVATGLGHRAEDLLAAQMPLLLPLEMPEQPELGDADEARETTLRELQAVVRAPGLPAALHEAGVEFALVTAGMKSVRAFHENLAAVVAAGLPEDQALAAVTTTPARLLGLDRTLGTIEPGKLANLLVVEGDLFVDKPQFRHVFVDGYHEEIEAEEIIGDPDAVVDPRGTWEITTAVMGRSSDSTWTIRGSAGNYDGHSESSRGDRNDFRRVELRGNAMTVVSATPRGEFEITVVITGEKLSGETTMESPRGSATMKVEGRRVSGPESEQ
jgi:imidazolonepropionase-like amidohydrolase